MHYPMHGYPPPESYGYPPAFRPYGGYPQPARPYSEFGSPPPTGPYGYPSQHGSGYPRQHGHGYPRYGYAQQHGQGYPQQHGNGYPQQGYPQQHGHGYGYPQQHGHGYPQQSGHTYHGYGADPYGAYNPFRRYGGYGDYCYDSGHSNNLSMEHCDCCGKDIKTPNPTTTVVETKTMDPETGKETKIQDPTTEPPKHQ